MSAQSTIRNRRREAGIALLISIFILLLISVVAIALIVASGTESSLAGNYRSATGVYYAALGGLEEARGRLLAKDPNSFKNKAPATFLHLPGNTLAINEVRYVLNPGSTDGNVLTTYPDTEYDTEFGAGKLAAAVVQTTPSVWNSPPLNALPVPGPLYKWVRINGITEQSLNLDVFPNDLTIDPKLVYYDGTNLNDTGSGSQVLEITSLAVFPNGSQKLLQYLTAPVPITLPPFLAALTLSGSTGNGVAFHAPASNLSYAVKGNDYDCFGNPSLFLPKHAIGVFTNTDKTIVINNIPSSPLSVRLNYTGSNPAPDVEDISGSFPAGLQIPSQLDALAQSIIQNADAVITPTPSGTAPYLGTATGANLTPLGMSTTNPLSVVVNGNLDISNWSDDGDGLLLVTGTFTYDPDTIWNGIILVIGQGKVDGSHAQYKQINGAMLVAKTRDNNNLVLAGPNLGGAFMVFSNSMQGNGIRYSSCWIQKSQPTANYKILSFHEISQ